MTPLALTTERLCLRQFRPDDLDALARIYADPATTRYLLGGPRPRAQTERRLQEITVHWDSHGFGLWAVVDGQTDRLIGACGLRHIEEIADVELHYVLARSAWGQGLAREAAYAALGDGFRRIGLPRVIAFALPDNKASLRVMEKLGMRFERDGGFRRAAVKVHGIGRAQFLAQENR